MKKLSEQLLELSQRTAAWENRIAARHEESRKEDEAGLAEARVAVESAQAAFAARLNSMEQSLSAQWRELQEIFNKQVAAARGRAAERKATQDLADARERVDDVEAYAETATEFARLTAAEANAAMLKATEARAHANSLEQATSSSASATAPPE